MSVITDITPPVPRIKPLEENGANQGNFTPAWAHWFLQIKFKIDSINQNLYDLSNVVGNGLAVRNPDGTWTTTSVVPVGSGGTGLTDVTAGSFLRGTGTSPLEERTPSQVRSDIQACPEITTTHTSGTGGSATALPAQPVGYAEVVINGNIQRVPYYD